MSTAGDPSQPPSDYPAGGQPPPSYAAGAAPGRPIGEPRSPATVILLSIVTLGIYAIWWNYRVFTDMKEYSGQGVGGGIALILALFVGFVNPFLQGSELHNIYQAEGQEPPVSAATGAWILLPLIGWIIFIVKVQNATNDLWVAHGATPK